jgi:hypothetical protein
LIGTGALDGCEGKGALSLVIAQFYFQRLFASSSMHELAGSLLTPFPTAIQYYLSKLLSYLVCSAIDALARAVESHVLS